MAGTYVLLWLLASTPSPATAPTSTIGWGCHTCGFKNGPTLTGVSDAGGLAASSLSTRTGNPTVTLRSAHRSAMR